MSMFSVVTSTGRKVDVAGERFEMSGLGHLSILDESGDVVGMFCDWSSVIRDQRDMMAFPQKPIAGDAIHAL